MLIDYVNRLCYFYIHLYIYSGNQFLFWKSIFILEINFYSGNQFLFYNTLIILYIYIE